VAWETFARVRTLLARGFHGGTLFGARRFRARDSCCKQGDSSIGTPTSSGHSLGASMPRASNMKEREMKEARPSLAGARCWGRWSRSRDGRCHCDAKGGRSVQVFADPIRRAMLLPRRPMMPMSLLATPLRTPIFLALPLDLLTEMDRVYHDRNAGRILAISRAAVGHPSRAFIKSRMMMFRL